MTLKYPPFFATHIPRGDHPYQVVTQRKDDENVTSRVCPAKGIEARLITGMAYIRKGHQRSIEENLLAFRGRNPMPLPALQEVSLIPLKANAFAQNIIDRHALYVYVNNIHLSTHDTLFDDFTEFGSRLFSVIRWTNQPGLCYRNSEILESPNESLLILELRIDQLPMLGFNSSIPQFLNSRTLNSSVPLLESALHSTKTSLTFYG
jgi:hypothetical protein